MSFRLTSAFAAGLLACASAASAQSVNLQFDAGRVTLVANNAPIRTILTEWARLGGTRMVNAERLVGGPITLELRDVTERQALETLLRSAVGYVITDREGSGAGASTIGGVVILATSAAPRVQPPVTFGPTIVQQRQPVLFEDTGNADAPRPVPVPFAPPPTPGDTPTVTRGVVTLPTGTPDPPTSQPPQQKPTPTFTTLPGTSRPGEITPPPPQQQPAR